MNELIAVKQLPIIEERLKDLSVEIDRQVTEALNLAVTPETVKTVKEVRAGLNKQFNELENQRKNVKNLILEPYNQFDRIYKQYVSVRFSEADAELKRKINSVEEGLKKEKEAELRDYFRELADSLHLPWLDYERGRFNVTLSKSMKAMKQEVSTFVERVHSDVQAISVMTDSAKIMSEYKLYLRLGEAVETVKMRREAEEREMQAQEKLKEIMAAEAEKEKSVREEAEKASADFGGPVLEEETEEEAEETATLTFTVTATISKLKELKRFLNEGGY